MSKEEVPSNPVQDEEPQFEVKHSSGLDESIPASVQAKAAKITNEKSNKKEQNKDLVAELQAALPASKPGLQGKSFARSTKERPKTVRLPSDEDEDESLFGIDEDLNDDDEYFQEEEQDEFEEVEEPEPRKRKINKKVEWQNFMKFQKKMQQARPPRIATKPTTDTNKLKRIEDNMEIVRRIANVKYKPQDQLTMDDYLAWYAVEEGKVDIPGPLMDLIRPDFVRVSPGASQSNEARPPERPQSRHIPSQSPLVFEPPPISDARPSLSSESDLGRVKTTRPVPIRQPTPGIFSLGNLF